MVGWLEVSVTGVDSEECCGDGLARLPKQWAVEITKAMFSHGSQRNGL